MEYNDNVGFRNEASLNHIRRFVLPRIDGETTRRSLTGSETFSFVTSASGTLSPESDSDLENMAVQEEEEDDDENADDNESEQEDKAKEDGKKRYINSEKEIRLSAKAMLKKELKGIRVQAAAKKNEIKKKFKFVIDDARSQLIACRIEAEKVSNDKLEERAGLQQAKILQERAQRKKDGKNEFENERSRAHSVELALLRKIQADLDRVRARRKHSLPVALSTVNGKAKVANLLQYEVKKLERAQEVQKIIVELYSLGLTEAAINLTHSLKSKEDSENRLRRELKDEQGKATKRAMLLVEDEVKNLRKKYAAELEKKEQEKAEKERLEKERQERERSEREMAKLNKMVRDMAMKKMYEESMFNTSVSRPFSFSYFPSLKK